MRIILIVSLLLLFGCERDKSPLSPIIVDTGPKTIYNATLLWDSSAIDWVALKPKPEVNLSGSFIDTLHLTVILDEAYSITDFEEPINFDFLLFFEDTVSQSNVYYSYSPGSVTLTKFSRHSGSSYYYSIALPSPMMVPNKNTLLFLSEGDVPHIQYNLNLCFEDVFFEIKFKKEGH
jgi:hypothetical protein